MSKQLLTRRFLSGLLLLALSFGNAEELSQQHTQNSFNHLFKVSIWPAEGTTLINEYHSWILHLEDASGNHIKDASFTISGGMVAHGHGLPSKPVVSRYLGNGEYLIEGVLFNMSGIWTLQFIIQTPTVSDRVRFDFEVKF
jgi:hypothetical protein